MARESSTLVELPQFLRMLIMSRLEIEPETLMRRAAAFFVFLCLASIAGLSQPKAQSQKFVGAWRLVSVEGQPPQLPGAYDRPTGLLIYDASGVMSVQVVMKASRKPFAPSNQGRRTATPEEKAAAFETYAAYFGTFTVDDEAGTITHHLEDSLIPGRQGTDNVRWFEFQGNDRLVLIPIEDGKGGTLARKDATYKLVWERIR